VKKTREVDLATLATRFTLGALSRAWTDVNRTPWPRHDTTNESQYQAWKAYGKGLDVQYVQDLNRTIQEANRWYQKDTLMADALGWIHGNDPFLPIDLHRARQRIQRQDPDVLTARMDPALMKEMDQLVQQVCARTVEKVDPEDNYNSVRTWMDIREQFHDELHKSQPAWDTRRTEAVYLATLAHRYLDKKGEIDRTRLNRTFAQMAQEKGELLAEKAGKMPEIIQQARTDGTPERVPALEARMLRYRELSQKYLDAAKRPDWHNLQTE
jgi:hypothetical protein